MRKFEKISFGQFKKDIIDDEMVYNNLEIPKRSTKNSAGYDFRSPTFKVFEKSNEEQYNNFQQEQQN